MLGASGDHSGMICRTWTAVTFASRSRASRPATAAASAAASDPSTPTTMCSNVFMTSPLPVGDRSPSPQGSRGPPTATRARRPRSAWPNGPPASTPGAQVERAWAEPAGAVAVALGVDPAAGLPPAEAARRLDLSGPNELVERARKPPWRLLAEQFGNTMIVVLLIAAAITAAVGDLKDTLVILAILVLNGLVG